MHYHCAGFHKTRACPATCYTEFHENSTITFVAETKSQANRQTNGRTRVFFPSASLQNAYKDGQCTYNATLRSVRATVVAVETNEYYILWVCVCRIGYPERNAHEPYCNLWPQSTIFPHYLINGTIFGGGGWGIKNKMRVLIFSTTFVWNISHPKNNWARYDQKSRLVK